MATNATYALISSGSWVTPAGVTSITVECFGSTSSLSFGTLLFWQSKKRKEDQMIF
jgi:hypothetical protein